MNERRGLLPTVAALVLAAVLGGAVALAAAAALGVQVKETQTVREVGSFDPEEASFDSEGGLSVNDIYRRSAPGVVQITSTSVRTTEDPFFPFPQQFQERHLGSGFVIDKSGHIVTNYHVVQGAREVEVSFSNNDSMEAEIVGTDPATDIAVLKVKASSRALTPLPLGDSDDVQVGDDVVAIGNPFGYTRSVTKGIVSALQRQIVAPDSFRSRIDQVIQTDAPINKGNSGGPLLNANGEVIGVNTQISTGNTGEQGNVGIGFAVPIDTVNDVASQLIDKGRVERASLGISAQPITAQIARFFRLPVRRGLLVADVTEGSGADEAGIRAGTTQVVVAGQTYVLGGDLIVKADGVPVPSVERLRSVLADKKPGDEMELELYRDGEKETVDVELGRQPTETPPGD